MSLVRRDVATRTSVTRQVGPVSIATDTNTDGTAIDLADYPGWKVLLIGSVGTRTDGTFTFKLQSSADGSTSWTDETAVDGSVAAISAASTTRVAAYSPSRPYVRIRLTSASTSSGALVAGYVVLLPPDA